MASRSGWRPSGTRQGDGRSGSVQQLPVVAPRTSALESHVSPRSKRLFVGRPLRSDRLSDTLLPKRLALPVFCSDPLSSVAYATEQIILVLALGGLSLLSLTPWTAVGVVALMVIVIVSYRQTCHACPNGGGAYTVSRQNLGGRAGLVAASALLVDDVLTVSVSVVAGVAAITSAFPELSEHAVAISLGFVARLTSANLAAPRSAAKRSRSRRTPSSSPCWASWWSPACGWHSVTT